MGESISSKPAAVADTLDCLALSDLFRLDDGFLTDTSSGSGSSSSSMVALDGRLEVLAGGGREPVRTNSVDLLRVIGLCSNVTKDRGEL